MWYNFACFILLPPKKTRFAEGTLLGSDFTSDGESSAAQDENENFQKSHKTSPKIQAHVAAHVTCVVEK